MKSIKDTVTAFNDAMAENITRFEKLKGEVLEALEKGAIHEDLKKEFTELVQDITIGTAYIQNALKAAILVEREATLMFSRVEPKK